MSPSTVSRTLQQPELVAEATRKAVLQAVEATGYRANIIARNLRKGRTGAVLAVVPNLANSFHAEILSGLSDALAEDGMSVLVADRRQAGRLDPRRADGVVLLDGAFCTAVSAALERFGTIPAVLVDDGPCPAGWTQLRADNHAGGTLTIRHLLARGHRRIGILAGPAASAAARARQGWLEAALHAAGLHPAWRADGDFGMEAGARAAAEILALPRESRPEAVACASDAAAIGMATALMRAGLRVPGDMAVMGYDDLDLAASFRVPLTTIAQPRREIGHRAGVLMTQKLAGTPVPPLTTLPVRLVVRDSA